MASTPSTIGNVEQIGIGEQLATWGVSLNAVIDRLTEMAVGVTSVSLTGNYTLPTTNYVANESRWGGLRFADGGLSSAPTVTFPAETRSWLVINTGSTYAVNCLAAGSGVSAVSVAAGKWAIIDCDGTDMFIRDLSTMGGDLALSSIADIASSRVIGNMSGSTAAPSLITVYDEDNMASNSATGLATQQSIKAYVDTIASTGDLATVAGIASEITTVADIEDGTVATNAVTDVAGIASNVTTVAGISGNVTTVAGISANVTTVAGISANVTTVAGDSADIQTLAPISANITTVAGISSDVTAVAADATDIGTVSTNIASVNTCATNIVDIQNAATIANGLVDKTGDTMTGELIMSDQLVTRPLLKDFGLEVSAIGNVGATRTFDITNANYFTATVDQASTFTFSNPTASGDACVFYIELTNGGAFTITWPGAVSWDAAAAPTLQASGVDVLAFVTTDGGTTYRGFPVWQAA